MAIHYQTTAWAEARRLAKLAGSEARGNTAIAKAAEEIYGYSWSAKTVASYVETGRVGVDPLAVGRVSSRQLTVFPMVHVRSKKPTAARV